MNHHFKRLETLILIVLLLASGFICAGCSTDAAVAGESTSTTHYQKWEYYTLFVTRLQRSLEGNSLESVNHELDALGAEGWEVATTSYDANDNYSVFVILKRPLAD